MVRLVRCGESPGPRMDAPAIIVQYSLFFRAACGGGAGLPPMQMHVVNDKVCTNMRGGGGAWGGGEKSRKKGETQTGRRWRS